MGVTSLSIYAVLHSNDAALARLPTMDCLDALSIDKDRRLTCREMWIFLSVAHEAVQAITALRLLVFYPYQNADHRSPSCAATEAPSRLHKSSRKSVS